MQTRLQHLPEPENLAGPCTGQLLRDPCDDDAMPVMNIFAQTALLKRADTGSRYGAQRL
jgi:hypothetical protein